MAPNRDRALYVMTVADHDDALRARLTKLARALCVEPLPGGPCLEKAHGKWWLTRCVGGDTALPTTRGARTPLDALAKAEAWVGAVKRSGYV